MYYVDTNILITAFTPEPHQNVARRWLVAHQEDVHISDWVVTEFASALSIKCRAAHLNQADQIVASRSFDRYVDKAVHLLPVRREDFRAAARWCQDPEPGLRAGDSLHLAVAANHHLTLVTRDRAMVKSASTLRLAAQLLQETS